ncbi:hypothetical protein J6590_021595 [Homalodisca vitripennis]|nr:hypothetical protein J6590_021595 [Homalodisca vitripennis]
MLNLAAPETGTKGDGHSRPSDPFPEAEIGRGPDTTIGSQCDAYENVTCTAAVLANLPQASGNVSLGVVTR